MRCLSKGLVEVVEQLGARRPTLICLSVPTNAYVTSTGCWCRGALSRALQGGAAIRVGGEQSADVVALASAGPVQRSQFEQAVDRLKTALALLPSSLPTKSVFRSMAEPPVRGRI